MKGGINKLIRNIAATKGKSDFDKVIAQICINKILINISLNIDTY